MLNLHPSAGRIGLQDSSPHVINTTINK
jgi:hypothetical protein